MDAKKFGAFLAATRKEKNMTQAQLVEKIDVTDKAVSRWERGLGFPDITTMEPLADALGISLLELMCSATEMNRQQGMQDKQANVIAAIALVVAAALAYISGKCSIGGALFFGGIVGLLAAFGILWYFSGVFASLWT